MQRKYFKFFLCEIIKQMLKNFKETFINMYHECIMNDQEVIDNVINNDQFV